MEKTIIPTELLKEFMGKVCSINILNESEEICKIIAIEGNWIKVENDSKIKLINGDMIGSIKIMPEKYQK